MIFVIINNLFNGFLVTTIFQIVYGELVKELPYWEYALMGYGTAVLLALLGVSKAGRAFLKLFLGGRDAIGSERQIIDPLLKTVLETANRKKGSTFTVENIHLLIKDTKEPDALAFGYNTIMLTDGLLKTADEEELKAVIAHEVGHLYYKDSVTLAAIVCGNYATRVCMWVYADYIHGKRFIMALSNRRGSFFVVLLIVPIIVFLPVIIIDWIGQKILGCALLWHGRKTEYRADLFANELGFGKGLIGFLEKVNMSTGTNI